MGASRGEQRFSSFVLPELDALLRLALSLTDQPADAEDLVQETLLRAYRSIARFDGAHPRAWLFTIMRHAQANTLRRRRPVLVADVATVDGPADAAMPDVVVQQVMGDTFDAVVENAFTRLSLNDQDVLRLVDIGGLSYADTALVLGISEDAVTSRLHRARSRLRDRLARSGFAPKPRFRWQGALS